MDRISLRGVLRVWTLPPRYLFTSLGIKAAQLSWTIWRNEFVVLYNWVISFFGEGGGSIMMIIKTSPPPFYLILLLCFFCSYFFVFFAACFLKHFLLWILAKIEVNRFSYEIRDMSLLYDLGNLKRTLNPLETGNCDDKFHTSFCSRSILYHNEETFIFQHFLVWLKNLQNTLFI